MTMISTPKATTRARAVRHDGPAPDRSVGSDHLFKLLSLVAIISLTLIGAGNLDVGATEARLGLAAGERIGPLGIVYGLWEPGLLAGRVIPSRLWALGFGEITATTAAVRWPEAIAGGLIGLVLTIRLGQLFGAKGSLIAALAFCGTIAVIDRSGVNLALFDSTIAWLLYQTTGSYDLLLKPILPDPNWIAALFTMIALERIRSRGMDTVGGILAGLGFLVGGWPVLATIGLPAIVLPRRESGRPVRMIAAILVAVIGWTAWTISAAGLESWASAIALPLTKGPAWTLIPWVLIYALPWSPFAGLVGFKSLRAGWSDEQRSVVFDWAKIIAALALGGTLIPGLGDPARIPMIAGLVIITVGLCDRLLVSRSRSHSSKASSRIFGGLVISVSTLWAVLIVSLLGYVAAAIGAYRQPSLLLIAIAVSTLAVSITGLVRKKHLISLGALVLIAFSMKYASWSIVNPEWNYRASQGPWGRAIQQWMPRTSTLYFTNNTTFDPQIPNRDRWPVDLAFHVGRRVREIPAPESLSFLDGGNSSPHFVLLHPEEFEQWPKAAPPLVLIRELQDHRGIPRILARTEGPLYPVPAEIPE